MMQKTTQPPVKFDAFNVAELFDKHLTADCKKDIKDLEAEEEREGKQHHEDPDDHKCKKKHVKCVASGECDEGEKKMVAVAAAKCFPKSCRPRKILKGLKDVDHGHCKLKSLKCAGKVVEE